jgi:hypothetical protein
MEAEILKSSPAPRKFIKCGKGMYEGFVVQDADTYCSQKCMSKDGISEAEYNEMYDNDAPYWTSWEHGD